MNPSDTLTFDESQIELLFADAGLVDTPVVNEVRVEKVMERAMHEKVIKELSSFAFEGFPAVVDGLLSVTSNKINHPDGDYKC